MTSHGPDDVLDLSAHYEGDEPSLRRRIGRFASEVQRMRQIGSYLWQHTTHSAAGRRGVVDVDGAPREMVLMSSNNYLGLSTHRRVTAAAQCAIEQYGTGASASPLGAGGFAPHRVLERRLAEVKEADDACLFASGYAANVGVLTALARRSDTVLIDRYVHASLVDGARATGAKVRVFRHNHLGDLEARLATASGNRFIVVDAVYSMDGDLAPLPELVALAHRYDAWLILDEAHATGVVGRTGLGLCEHFGVHDERVLVVGTLSKALAASGGFFAGPADIVEYVRHYARSYLFSTALPPMVVAAAAEALQVMLDEPERVRALRANGDVLRSSLRDQGLAVPDGETPIIPVIVGDPRTLLEAARFVLARGVHVNAVFPPAVPLDQSRLRLSVISTHTPRDLAITQEAVVGALVGAAGDSPVRRMPDQPTPFEPSSASAVLES